MRRAAILAALLALAACTTPSPSTASQASAEDALARQHIEAANQLLQLSHSAGLNETIDFGHGLTVTPLAVLEDSRCPEDVTCVWAGRVRIRVRVVGVEQEMTLNQPLAVQPAGHLVLTVIAPPRLAHWPAGVPHAAYRFGFSTQA